MKHLFLTTAILAAFCPSAGFSQYVWQRATPGAPIYHAVAYDLFRDRVVMFGGLESDGETWEYDGTTWELRETPVAPPRRRGGTMDFDIARGVTVLFGGTTDSGVRLGDTWEWDGTTWRNVSPPAPSPSPSPRAGHAFVYVPSAGGMLLFGGEDPALPGQIGAPRSDTWLWDGTNWTDLTGTFSPSPRIDARLAYDSARQRAVLYGGWTGAAFVPTSVWEWSPSAGWQVAASAASSGGPDRLGHQLVYDVVSQRTVMWGGSQSGTDAWEWDGTTWIQTAEVAPASIQFGAATYDHVRARIVHVGGLRVRSRIVGTAVPETWTRDVTGWTLEQFSGIPPQSPFDMVFDRMRGEAIATIQDLNSPAGTTTWAWNGTSWRLVALASPQVVGGHALAYDATRGLVFLFGGVSATASGAALGDMWTWNGQSWTLAATTGPSARIEPAMAYDSARDRLVLFGGFDARTGATLADTWEWDGQRWTQMAPALSPPDRASHGMVFDAARGRVVMFGGATLPSQVVLGDLWEWDGAVWSAVSSATPSPGPRADFAMAYDTEREVVMMHGGSPNGSSPLGDLWEWDGQSWSPRQSLPIAIDRHAMVFDSVRSELIVAGGRTQETWVGLPTIERVGDACAHSLGGPSLRDTASSSARIGATFELDILNVPAGAAAAMWLGLDQLAPAVPLGALGRPDCSIRVNPLVVQSVVVQVSTLGVGIRRMALPIPNDLSAIGLTLFAQGVVLTGPSFLIGLGLTELGIATVR